MWITMAQDEKPPRPDRAHLRAQIDENLRRVYEEALEEEVPDRIRQLVEALRAKTEKT